MIPINNQYYRKRKTSHCFKNRLIVNCAHKQQYMVRNCGIIDDDSLAISIIKSYIDKIPNLQLVFTLENPLAGEKYLHDKPVDLLFLDVEMPQISGLEFLHTLTQKPKVIITSAKKDYAAEGFDLDVLDYIVKPVTFQRFSQSIKKFFALDNPVQEPTPKQNLKDPEFLFLKENKKKVKVAIDNILYVESIKDYIKVYTTQKTVVTKEQISNFLGLLPPDKFLRVHRSYLVAIQKIDAYSASTIEIKDTKIPIGRNYKDLCLEILGTL